MSDLSCPATLLVARHGDAEYVDTVFSDEGGWLSREGRAQSVRLAERIADRKVARVWSSDVSRCVQTAEIAAQHLGVEVVTRTALREVYAGALLGRPFDVRALEAVTGRWFDGELAAAFDGGESGVDVVSRYREALQEIADQHRGETVLVVGHQTAAGIALPTLATGLHPEWVEHHQMDNGDVAELEVDGDGWRLLRWPSV